MAAAISHRPYFLQPYMSHEGECLRFHPQVGLCLPDPGSLVCGGHLALVGGGSAEFVTFICPPLSGPHHTSRALFSFLVTFPGPCALCPLLLPAPPFYSLFCKELTHFLSPSPASVPARPCGMQGTHKEGDFSQGTSWALFSGSRTKAAPGSEQKRAGGGLEWGGSMALGCKEGQAQMAPESWHNQGRMSGILEEHLLHVTLWAWFCGGEKLKMPSL